MKAVSFSDELVQRISDAYLADCAFGGRAVLQEMLVPQE
jgi:hypothetical protein